MLCLHNDTHVKQDFSHKQKKNKAQAVSFLIFSLKQIALEQIFKRQFSNKETDTNLPPHNNHVYNMLYRTRHVNHQNMHNNLTLVAFLWFQAINR